MGSPVQTCEKCHMNHNGSYGSGRFCSVKCARAYATAAKRKDINKQVSKKLTGRPGVSRPNTPEQRAKIGLANAVRVKAYQEKVFLERYNLWLYDQFLPQPRLAKKFLIHAGGNKCHQCGWDKVHPVTGIVPVQIHHKDGKASNNRCANVELLCPNCHSLTPNFMALNKDPNNSLHASVMKAMGLFKTAS